MSLRTTRQAGAALGACLAVTLIVLALPAGGRGGVAGASLDLTVATDAAVAVAPASPSVLLRADDMRPAGGAQSASFDLTNEAGRPVALAFEADPASTALDGIVEVAISDGGKRLLTATIGELRHGPVGALRLAAGARRSLRVSVSVPATVATGYEGHHVALELVPVVHGAAR